MLFYLSLLALCLTIGLIKQKKLSLLLIIFVLGAVSAARFDVGYDYVSYYMSIEEFDLDSVYQRFGYLHGGLIQVSSWLNFSQFYFLVTSIFIYLFLYMTVKRDSANYLLSILTFIAIPVLFLMSFNYVKQFTAIMFMFFCSKYIYSRSFVKYLISLLFAYSLHVTALVVLPLYYLYKVKLPYFIWLLAYLLSWVGFEVAKWIVSVMLPFYSHYLETSVSGGFSFQVLLGLCFFLSALFYSNRKSSREVFYLQAFYLGVCLYNLFQPIGFAGTRISYYFLIYILLIVPYVAGLFKYRQSIVLFSFLSCVLFSIALVVNSKVGTRSPSIPYQAYWGKTVYDLRPYGWVKE